MYRIAKRDCHGSGTTAITLLVLVASLSATASARGAPGDLDTSFATGGKSRPPISVGTTPLTAARCSVRSASWWSSGGPSPAPGLALILRSLSIAPTARSTRPFRATASRPPTSAATASRTGLPSSVTARSWSSGTPMPAAHSISLSPATTPTARWIQLLGGMQITDLSGGTDSAAAVVIQPDGKVVAAGLGGDDFGLARYNTDGSLDLSFGVGGIQRTHLGATGYDSDYAAAVALQADEDCRRGNHRPLAAMRFLDRYVRGYSSRLRAGPLQPRRHAQQLVLG